MIPPKKCLSCKYFRPEDQFTGRCRVDKASLEHYNYPLMNHDDLCQRWKDAGQQYYIRVGWVKNVITRTQNSEDS